MDGVTFTPPNGSPSTDQRGVARPQGKRHDIGAFELVKPLFLPFILRNPCSETSKVSETFKSGDSDICCGELRSSLGLCPRRAHTLECGHTGGALVWNTFLGGSGQDLAQGIAVGQSGNIYAAGRSANNWGSPVRAYTSGTDGFIARIDEMSVYLHLVIK